MSLATEIDGQERFPFAGSGGTAVNSDAVMTDSETAEFKRKITDKLAESGLGRGAVNYAARLAVQSSALLGRAVSDLA